MKTIAYFFQKMVFRLFLTQFSSFYSPLRFHKN